jgi:aryl-phospho-beta-D-glucosidase BglC (GH1 family)
MHAIPGGQNGDWHSDNLTSYAAFWDHKDFQDRTIWVWKEIATRYRDNPWVASYNPLNEAAHPEYSRLPAFYDRLQKAICEVDPRHILWLDGNTYAMEWTNFDHVLPNCVYAIHDYSVQCFRIGSSVS